MNHPAPQRLRLAASPLLHRLGVLRNPLACRRMGAIIVPAMTLFLA